MKKILILFALLLVNCVSSFAQYTFNHIPIGGGGFVTGVISNKTTGDIYCRTDVGGAYRWDAANNKWVQLLDWFSEDESGFNGVEALAIDNQNPNNIYMLCGTSYVNNGRTAILKSTNKGNTFTYVDVTTKFKAHGNGYGRGNGERLAVDPNNSNILFCGTRGNGLWKSTDSGVTWNLAWNGVTTTTNGNGICFVVFDPSSASGGITQTIYIGISRTGSDNIYKSTDGGATFTPMSATTSYFPHRAVLQGTTMYVTYADNEGPGTNNVGRVFKLNTSTGAWTNFTPLTWGTNSLSYGGVDIDPANVNRVVISTTGVYNNNQYGKTWGDFVYLSTDGGTNWTLKNGSNSKFDNNGIGCASGQDNWAECAVFDPTNSNLVRVVGGGGIFACSDITATNPVWKYDVIGIEETAFLDGVSVPGGPFICAMGDMTGFLFTNLTAYPTQFLTPGSGTNRSVAYASANVNKLVRTSDADAHVYYSTNMGTTWTACATSKGSGGRATLSADGETILHCPNDTAYYSNDNGATWGKSTGMNFWGAIPVADPVNSNYFYINNPGDGKMYVSSNKGVSFSVAGNSGSSSNPWTTNISRAAPGNEGHIWVPQIANGLKYSTDHGQTYTTVSNVSYCRSIGFGKTASGASYPTIFIWGTVSGTTGLFRSTDKGATWLRMNDNAHQFGGLETLIGDMNIFGRLYTGGGGIIYWDDQASTSISDVSVTTEQINLYPNPSSSVFHIEMVNPDQVSRIAVYDMMGRQVEAFDRSEIKGTMVVGESLKPSMYIVRISGENWIKFVKVIKG
jgi:BNR/Asp-box repeat.